MPVAVPAPRVAPWKRPAPREDLLLVGLAAHRVVEPRELEVGLVGLAAAAVEEDVAKRRSGGSSADEASGEPRRGLVAEVPEARVVGELAHLRRDGVGDLVCGRGRR